MVNASHSDITGGMSTAQARQEEEMHGPDRQCQVPATRRNLVQRERSTSRGRQAKWCARVFAVLIVWATTAIALSAQTFTNVFDFETTNGKFPLAPVFQGTDGNLHGSAEEGGADGVGSIFSISSVGTLVKQQSLDSTNGAFPLSGLLEGTDSYYYGTTSSGGTGTCNTYGASCGTIFKISSSGVLTTVHSFDFTDGWSPEGGLVEGSDENLYGTTEGGGSGSCVDGGINYGCGTVFKMASSGAVTTLYSFCSRENCADGSGPTAGLIQADDSNFYGTTAEGGANLSCTNFGHSNGCGTVFQLTAEGKLTILHNFCSAPSCADGQWPAAGLVQGSDGNFYGTTSYGGNITHSCANGCGTVFRITPGGHLTRLWAFCSDGCTDGEYPSGLIQGTDGNFYGTTTYGGDNGVCSSGCGTVFEITSTGTLTTLYAFCPEFGCYDGAEPQAGLIQNTDGSFYGTTSSGGTSGVGAVFSLSTGLGPFVAMLPTSGGSGRTVRILGTSLTGATSVTFNGISADFTVESASYISATVPVGATSGTVKVVTPGGTLSSNVPFRVIQ